MRTVLFVLACAGCHTYVAGRLLGDSTARTVGCLDVSLTRSGDAEAPVADPVLQYRFGNRCRTATRVDLTRVRVVAEYGAGRVELAPYDPRRELRPAALAGRDEARETIEYTAPPWADGEPRAICVDLSGISDKGGGAREVCL